MSLLDAELQKNLEILKALDKALAEGPWEETLFLRGIGLKLREARARFLQESGLDEQAAKAQAAVQAATQSLIQDVDAVEVYVSLYQAEGADIRKWTLILASLPALSITRPIYKNEEDVKAAIRTKEYKINDAYVGVRVNKNDIKAPTEDKPPFDRYGRELLVLREGAIRTENVTRFIHVSGEYHFHHGVLVK